MLFRLPQSKASLFLVSYYPEFFSLGKGMQVTFSKRTAPGFEIRHYSNKIRVSYFSLSDKYRALGQLIIQPHAISLCQTPSFDFRGLLIDVSRNGVLKVSFLKEIIIKLSLAGINYVGLYTEDTFEVKGHPLIGYKRGCYSKKEIREIVDFGELFGVELFPCIQTLGHLSQLLKYEEYSVFKDNSAVLNVENAQTYELLYDLISSASALYRSKFIHVGMDETEGLGRGKSFKVRTKIDPSEIYIKHLKQISKICGQLYLKPIIWSDILLGDSDEFKAISPKHAKKLPRNLNYNLWNYYTTKVERYKWRIEEHRKRSMEPIISPGVWNWNRFWGLYPKFNQTALPFLKAAKEDRIKRVLITMWGDDGQEAPFRSNYPALFEYAEHCWIKEPDIKNIKNLTKALTKDDFDVFIKPSEMDFINEQGVEMNSNLAKCFLYDDPLLRLYSSHAGLEKFGKHYALLARTLKESLEHSSKRNRTLFKFSFYLVDCLSMKADIGNDAYYAYQANDTVKLKNIVDDSLFLSSKIKKTWESHRKVWLEENKPFGLEVLDQRYGGLLIRVNVFREKLLDYINGKIEIIEEFEEKHHNVWNNFSTQCLSYRVLDSISTVK